MTNEDKWRKRVEAWRASGRTSTQYCEGKPFTAGGLRSWAHRLEKKGGFKERRLRVRLARVLRVASPGPTATAVIQQQARQVATAAPDGTAVTLRVGRVQVAVVPGFDPATLSAVLDLLAARDAHV